MSFSHHHPRRVMPIQDIPGFKWEKVRVCVCVCVCLGGASIKSWKRVERKAKSNFTSTHSLSLSKQHNSMTRPRSEEREREIA